MATVGIRDKRVLIRKEVIELLGKQTFLDCCEMGWLKPCATKDGVVRDRNLYALRDVETCEARMIEGEYPNPKGGA